MTESTKPGTPPYQRMFDAPVRRADLSLRAQFPNLITRVFEIATHRYEIVVTNAAQPIEHIATTFEKTAPAHIAAKVVEALPNIWLREVATIGDEDVISGFAGLPLNRFDLFNLLVARFPDLPIARIEGGPDLTIYLGRAIMAEADAALRSFVDALDLGDAVSIRVSGGEREVPPFPGEDRLFIIALPGPHAPDFIRQDEAFWFENIEAAGRAQLRLDDFPGMVTGAMRCFIDAGLGRQLNLRQALLLYDEVYCVPPLHENREAFMHDQALTPEDLLTLVEGGRLKFVLTQPFHELDMSFLVAVNERRPDAILGRRTIATLLMADIATTAEEYRLNDPAHYPAIAALSALAANFAGLNPDQLLRAILWPASARRGALHGLLARGSKGGPALEIASLVAAKVAQRHGVDVALETMALSERVHIAHALGATVIPGLDEPESWTLLMRAISEDLNMYRGFSNRIVASWAGNQHRRAEGSDIVPPIPMFDFNPRIPLTELLESTAFASTRSKGRALFARLADLPIDQREDEIDRLSSLLRNEARQQGNLLTVDTTDTAIAVTSLFMGFVYPPVAGIKSLAAPLAERARRIPALDRFLDDMSRNSGVVTAQSRELDFLSRIDRVASFRVPRV